MGKLFFSFGFAIGLLAASVGYANHCAFILEKSIEATLIPIETLTALNRYESEERSPLRTAAMMIVPLEKLPSSKVPGSRQAGYLIWELGVFAKAKEVEEKTTKLIEHLCSVAPLPGIGVGPSYMDRLIRTRLTGRSIDFDAQEEGRLINELSEALSQIPSENGNLLLAQAARYRLVDLDYVGGKKAKKQIFLERGVAGVYSIVVSDDHGYAEDTAALEIGQNQLERLRENSAVREFMGSWPMQTPPTRYLFRMKMAKKTINKFSLKLEEGLQILGLSLPLGTAEFMGRSMVEALHLNLKHLLEFVMEDVGSMTNGHELSDDFLLWATHQSKMSKFDDVQTFLTSHGLTPVITNQVVELLGRFIRENGFRSKAHLRLELWGNRVHLDIEFETHISYASFVDGNIKNDPANLPVFDVKIAIVPAHYLSSLHAVPDSYIDHLAFGINQALADQ